MSLAMIFKVKVSISNWCVGFKNADVDISFQIGISIALLVYNRHHPGLRMKVFGSCHSRLQVQVVGKTAFVL